MSLDALFIKEKARINPGLFLFVENIQASATTSMVASDAA
jgi:hypothetical protein